MRKQKGFSLIELLIVVAIILIIAAIAIPNLIRSRIAANEASAAAGVRTLITSEVTYRVTNGSYTSTLSTLGPSGAGLIDAVLANANATAKSGYTYSISAAATDTFSLGAQPATAGTTGNRAFCATEQGVVYFNGNVATPGTVAACITGTTPLN